MFLNEPCVIKIRTVFYFCSLSYSFYSGMYDGAVINLGDASFRT